MNVRSLLLCTAIALTGATALTVTTVSAADAVVEPVEVIETTPEWNWSGAYVGLHGGYGWSNSDSSYNDDFFNENCGFEEAFGCAVDLDPDGAFGGIQAGYNYAFSNGFVIGVEGDWSFASLHEGDEGVFQGGNTATRVDLEIDQLATIQARFGYAAGQWLPFATLGWGWAHVERSAFNEDFGVDSSEKKWHNGWTIGAGLEYAIDDHWSVKGEYRYFDAGDEDYSLGFADGTNVDLQIHTVRFGVNYGF
jgi:outer membrane immunogenic protein